MLNNRLKITYRNKKYAPLATTNMHAKENQEK